MVGARAGPCLGVYVSGEGAGAMGGFGSYCPGTDQYFAGTGCDGYSADRDFEASSFGGAGGFRAGGASAMYHNGFSAEEIQRRGRWVSDVWKVYIQGNSEGAAAMTRRMSTNSTMLHDQLKGACTA